MSAYFGQYGGQFVPDTLIGPLQKLNQAYREIQKNKGFQTDLKQLLKTYVGRPSPLTFAARLSQELGAKIYLKREDLNHTGAHKINNTIGQGLLAKYMKKQRVIAETGAGQHGVATATVCALLGLDCVVYMGEDDMQRQALNVARMQLLGAEVIPVTTGSRTLKEATTQAIRDWLAHAQDTYYIIGSVLGPHPYPRIVRDFQRVIGQEIKRQITQAEGRLPDVMFACVGGGSNAMGMFYPFYRNKQVRLVACEAAGHGLDTGYHAASLSKGVPGVLHGSKNYVLQTPEGQVQLVHSISAGLDYPGVSPELSHWKDRGRIEVDSATDKEALEACQWLARREGIIPALESSHALAVLHRGKHIKPHDIVVVNLSGRGDKDMGTIMERQVC